MYTLARIRCWPPEDGSLCVPKHVGVNFAWAFNLFLINIVLWVHELVIIEAGHIDARFKHEVWRHTNLLCTCAVTHSPCLHVLHQIYFFLRIPNTSHIIPKATEIQLHPKNFSKNHGFIFSKTGQLHFRPKHRYLCLLHNDRLLSEITVQIIINYYINPGVT